MSLQRLTPMLRTFDLAASLDFYVEALGFTCVSHDPELQWALLEREGIALMLSGPNPHEGDTRAAFTGSFYFNCDDVDDWWARLKDLAQVCYPLEDFEYGMREFGVYDNNGYLLQFGQPLARED